MSQLKKFILISLVLLVIATAAVVYVWFKVQNLTATPVLQTNEMNDTATATTSRLRANQEAGMKIDTSRMTEKQKATAETFGIDVEAITITPEMLACGEKELGAERIAEITAGDSPTVIESGKLLKCL